MPVTRNTLESITFAIVSLAIGVICFHGPYDYVEIDFTNLITVIKSTFVAACCAVLAIHCYFTLYIIQQRVLLARNVVERFTNGGSRRFAWSSNQTVAQLRIGNVSTHAHYKVVTSVCHCVCDAYETAKRQ